MLGGCKNSNSDGSSTGGGKGKGGGGGGAKNQVRCDDPNNNVVCVEASNSALHGTCALPGKSLPTSDSDRGTVGQVFLLLNALLMIISLSQACIVLILMHDFYAYNDIKIIASTDNLNLKIIIANSDDT